MVFGEGMHADEEAGLLDDGSNQASLWGMSLFWMDSNGAWHHYAHRGPTPTVADLLDELDRDPTGIFWG